MKDQHSPITPDEVLLRLIWWMHYKPKAPIRVRLDAFEPKRDETDGISLFRAACLSTPAAALGAFAEDKRELYAIATLLAAEVMSYGVTIEPAPIDAVPGHAVIPELNIVAFQANKQHWRVVMTKLAELASREIIREPTV